MTAELPHVYIPVESATDQFRAAMERRGLIPPPQLMADGKIHRCSVEGKGGKNDGAYLLHLDDIAAGGFENHKDAKGWEKWRADTGRSLSITEQEAYKKRIEAIRRTREDEATKRNADAQTKAQAILSAGQKSTGEHPYEKRKRIVACPGVMIGEWPQRKMRGCLLIPMYDIDGYLRDVQAIFPAKIEVGGDRRDKDFLAGGRKKGAFFSIGQMDGAVVIAIGEGYATMMSCHMATGLPVVVAFDASNLWPVVESIRKKYHHARIIIAGDDDKWKVDAQGNLAVNKGRITAEKAAKQFNCHTIFPAFADISTKPTDFNDLHCLEGLEAVKAQLMLGMEAQTVQCRESSLTVICDATTESDEHFHPGNLFEDLKTEIEHLNAGDIGAIKNLIKKAEALDALHRRSIHNLIKTKTGVPLGNIREARAELNDEEALDHLMLARKVIEHIGKENLLSTVAHVWQWRDTGVWRAIPDIERKQFVQHTLERYKQEITRGIVDSVADVMKTEIFAPEHVWDRDRDTINFLNGELHRIGEEWQLQKHCREHYRTTQIPHVYDSSAECPRFNTFLHEIFRDDEDGSEKALLVAELLGYTLVSNARFEKFILLIGVGANGKSVLLDVIRELVGSENVAAVQPSQFDNRFQRAHLHLKLANLVTEVAEGAEIADAELKAITSGELTTAEHKFQPPFNFRPFCTCWFGTNHLPHTRDFSDALFRRAIVIHFNRVFQYGKDADPKLKEKLADEIPGIINMALRAYGEVLKRGYFTEPESCKQAKQEWRTEADQAAQFMGDMCDLVADTKITSAELYESYNRWANNAGVVRKLNRKNFTSRIERLGGKAFKGTGGIRMIAGIQLKSILEREC